MMIKKYRINDIVSYLIFIAVLFSIFLYFYRVDISLWYHQNQPIYFHNQTLGTIFKEPGEPAELLAAYIGQYMEKNAVGAFLLTLIIAIWIFFLKFLYNDLSSKRYFLFLVIFSVIPFLIAHSYYNYQLSFTLFYVLTILLTVIILPLIYHLKIYFTIILFTLLTAIIYILCGNPGLMLFFVLSASYSVLKKKYSYLFHLILLFIVPFIYTLFFHDISIKEAYLGNFLPGLFDFIPQTVKLLPVYFFFAIGIIILLPTKQKTVSWYYSVLIAPAILSIILGLVYYKSFDEDRKTKVLVNKLAYEEKWTEILRTAEKIDLTRNREIQFQVNRGLYHTGKLLSNMFYYPQYFGTGGIFLERKTVAAIAIQTSDLYYDMSFCNGSRHWANEAFIAFGPQPRILKRLASCYIATSQFELAKKYLSLLELSDQQREWAISMRKYIDCNNCVDTSAEFSHLLKFKGFDDIFISTSYPRVILGYLYAENYKNRMALEYTLAYDLLNYNLDEIIKNVPELKDFGYTKLPPPLQEAILLYVKIHKNPNIIDSTGFSIDIPIVEGAMDFYKILSSAKRNKAIIKPLLKKYKNTYMYYVVFNCPVTNGPQFSFKNID